MAEDKYSLYQNSKELPIEEKFELMRDYEAEENEKIKAINQTVLDRQDKFHKEIEEVKESEKVENIKRIESDDYVHDPYEDFEFGGLRGEEAYAAYWNID